MGEILPMTQPGITVHEATRVGAKAFLVSCTAHGCTHHSYIPASLLSPDLRIKTLEPRCRCTACGKLGADVRPDYSFWTK